MFKKVIRGDINRLRGLFILYLRPLYFKCFHQKLIQPVIVLLFNFYSNISVLYLLSDLNNLEC